MYDDMKLAAATSITIMQLVRTAPCRLSQKTFQLSERDRQAMISAPRTLQAAHSVAVIQPANRAPKTKSRRAAIGPSSPSRRTFRQNGIGGSAGGVAPG